MGKRWTNELEMERGGQMSWKCGAISHDNYGASNTLPNKIEQL